MRKIFKFSVCLSMIVMTNLAVAVELLPSMEVTVVDARKLKVSLMNARGNTLSILDQNENLFYQQEIIDGQYVKSFDFEILPAGKYLIKSTNEVQSKSFLITLSESGISLEEKETTFFPIVMKRGEMVYVNLFTNDEEPLDISIYNEDDKLIYKDAVKGAYNAGQIFDFSKSPSGEYRFYMANHGEITTKSIVIE